MKRPLVAILAFCLLIVALFPQTALAIAQVTLIWPLSSFVSGFARGIAGG